jgi:hypothetical protein
MAEAKPITRSNFAHMPGLIDVSLAAPEPTNVRRLILLPPSGFGEVRTKQHPPYPVLYLLWLVLFVPLAVFVFASSL